MSKNKSNNNRTVSSTETGAEKKISTLTYVLLIAVIVAAFLIGRVTAGTAAPGGQDVSGSSTAAANTSGQAAEFGITGEKLCELNRSELQNIAAEDGRPIYVIGHMSPDTDTVSSAIAYAELLQKLGYDAQARITPPVNHETAYILNEAGVEIPPVLEDVSGENIIMVDHSEYAQAAPGMSDANILAIMDHHAVGSVTTGGHVLYNAKPIGSTATVIWLNYLNYGIDIEPKTAYIMLGALLSDTSNLRAGSYTDADTEAASVLAKIAGVEDVDAFYNALHREALSYEGMSDEEILFSDYKKYEAGGRTFGIGIVGALDEDAAKELSERMKTALSAGYASGGADLLYAEISIRENGIKTDYIVPCEGLSQETFEAAFPNYDEFNGTAYIFRNGGLGRKTKFVPGLTDFLNAHPHE